MAANGKGGFPYRSSWLLNENRQGYTSLLILPLSYAKSNNIQPLVFRDFFLGTQKTANQYIEEDDTVSSFASKPNNGVLILSEEDDKVVSSNRNFPYAVAAYYCFYTSSGSPQFFTIPSVDEGDLILVMGNSVTVDGGGLVWTPLTSSTTGDYAIADTTGVLELELLATGTVNVPAAISITIIKNYIRFVTGGESRVGLITSTGTDVNLPDGAPYHTTIVHTTTSYRGLDIGATNTNARLVDGISYNVPEDTPDINFASRVYNVKTYQFNEGTDTTLNFASLTGTKDTTYNNLFVQLASNSSATALLFEDDDYSRDESEHFTKFPKFIKSGTVNNSFNNAVTLSIGQLSPGETVLIGIYCGTNTTLAEPIPSPNNLTKIGQVISPQNEWGMYFYQYTVTSEQITDWTFTGQGGNDAVVAVGAVYRDIYKIYPNLSTDYLNTFSTTNTVSLSQPKFSLSNVKDNSIVHLIFGVGYTDAASINVTENQIPGVIKSSNTRSTGYRENYLVIESFNNAPNTIGFNTTGLPYLGANMWTIPLSSYGSLADSALTEDDDTLRSTNFPITESNLDISEDDDLGSSVAFTYDAPTTGIDPAVLVAWSVGTSASIPSTPQNFANYLPDDIIVVYAYRDGNTTPPSLNANFVNINNQTGGGTNSARIAQRTYRAGDESSTWTFTNATSVITVVYRNVRAIGAVNQTNTTGTTAILSSFGLNEPGYSKVLRFIGHRSTNVTFPATTTLNTQNITRITQVQDATDSAAVYEDDGIVTELSADGGSINLGGTSSGYNVTQLELISSYMKFGVSYNFEDDDTLSTVNMISSEANISENDDTVSATSRISIRSNVSITEGEDTESAIATIRISGNASLAESADTVSATSRISIRSNVSITEGEDTVSSVVIYIKRAFLSITEADDTVSGESDIAGGLVSITEQDDTVSSISAVYDISYLPIQIDIDPIGNISKYEYTEIWAICYAAADSSVHPTFLSDYYNRIETQFNASAPSFDILYSNSGTVGNISYTTAFAKADLESLADNQVFNIATQLPDVIKTTYVCIKNGTGYVNLTQISPSSKLVLDTIAEGVPHTTDQYRISLYAVGFTGNNGSVLPDFTTASGGLIEKNVNFLSSSGGFNSISINMYDSYEYTTPTPLPIGYLNGWADIGSYRRLESDSDVGAGNSAGYLANVFAYENVPTYSFLFTAINEDDDTLSAFNYIRGFSDLSENDDIASSTGIVSINGVAQTEQDDFVLYSYGYHFDAPQPTPSTEFLGFTTAEIGNAITFPAGIQDGDFVVAYSPSLEIAFDEGWTSWSTINGYMSIALYSGTLSTPVATEKTLVFAFHGVDFNPTSSFAPVQDISINGENNTIYYGAGATIAVNNILDFTTYFKVFRLDTLSGLTSTLITELGSRVIHSVSISGGDYVFVIDGENNEPLQTIETTPFTFVSSESFTETLVNDYGIGLYGEAIMILPFSVDTPVGASRVEYLEEDDQVIRGAPIAARITEDDDYVLDSFAYKYTAAPLLGAEFVESYYVPYTSMSSITLDVYDLVVLVFDTKEAAFTSGGVSTNIGPAPTGWDNFQTNNITYAHRNEFVNPAAWTDDLGGIINGAWVIRYSNVGNDGNNLFIDPSSGSITYLNGNSIEIYTPSESYPVGGTTEEQILLRNSKAIRIVLVDFVDASAATPGGVTPSDMHSTLPESISLIDGSLTSVTDAYFAVDQIPIEIDSGEGEIIRVVDSDYLLYGPALGGESSEFLTLLFPAASLYAYGKNPNLQIVEEDDQLIRGAPIYLRLTEDDDFISESFGYQHEIGVDTSIERVLVDTVGFTNTFTLSSDDYAEGDLIMVNFTPDLNAYGVSETLIQNFTTDYPEFIPDNNQSYFTSYNYAMAFGLYFDGVTKTYTLSGNIHVNIVAYRGVVNLALTASYDSTPLGSTNNNADPGISTLNLRGSAEFINDNSVLYSELKNLMLYPTMVYYATLYNSEFTSTYPVESFSDINGDVVAYEVDTATSGFTFTTIVVEEFPSIVFFEDYGSGVYAYAPNVNFGDGYIVNLPVSAETSNYGGMFLVPQSVTFSQNRAEILEDDDTIEAVLKKGGVEADVAITEQDDIVEPATTHAQLRIKSTNSNTEENDTISAIATAPLVATFSDIEQDDFINSTALAQIKAVASITDANDTVSSVSNITLRSNLSKAEDSDSISSVTTNPLKAVASITDANDAISSTASLVNNGSLLVTEANDAISSTSTAPAKAIASLVEESDAFSSTAVVQIRATVSITEEGDTFESVTSGKTPLYAVMTEADDLVSSTSKLFVKAVSENTEANDVTSGTSQIPVFGTLITVEEADSVSSVTNNPVKASASNVEASDGLAFTSKLLVTASVNMSESDDVINSTSRVAVKASFGNTEENDSLSFVSDLFIVANSSNNEQSDSVLSNSINLVSASASNNEENDIVSSTSKLPVASNLVASENDDVVASSSKVAIVGAVVANEQDDYLNSLVLRTIPAFTDFVANSDFAAIANRIRYSTANFASAAELFGLGLKTITIAVEMTAESDFETIQTRTRNAFVGFEAEFDFNVISIPVPGTTYRIVYVIAEINRVNVDASMNTEDVMGLSNEEFILVEKV